MTIKRYGAGGSSGIAGQRVPAHAVQADGWLYVSSQVGMANGGCLRRHRRADEQNDDNSESSGAGYDKADIVRCGVWLSDPRRWPSFNRVFARHFDAVLPARTCIIAQMVVDCLVEIDCVACRAPT
jgi:enamine deaminase RidA (YjgF/YER057c/UK114 family)